MDQLTEFVTNNAVLFLALIIILVLLARTWITPGGVKGIGPMEAVGMSNHKNAVFIDVRTDDEYRDGHILHSLHAPLGLLDSKLKEISKYKNRPLILYCRSGNRSSQAGGRLKKQGFEQVYNLAGGVMAWQNASLPLTKDKTPPPGDSGSGSTDQQHKRSEDNSTDNAATVSDEASDTHASETNNSKTKASKTKASKTNANTRGEDSTSNQDRRALEEKVVVYTTRRCPFCVRAVNLLTTKGVGFKEIDIDQNPQLREEMEQKAKRKTVPQIFIGDVHVGGCDDMYDLENRGRLDLMLGLK
jgi:GrxC family glutaredoxin